MPSLDNNFRFQRLAINVADDRENAVVGGSSRSFVVEVVVGK